MKPDYLSLPCEKKTNMSLNIYREAWRGRREKSLEQGRQNISRTGKKAPSRCEDLFGSWKSRRSISVVEQQIFFCREEAAQTAWHTHV